MESRFGIAQLRVGAAFLASLALLGCGTSSGSSGGAKAEYIIGLTADLSGPVASVGGPVRDGARAYFNDLNRSGGVNGHQVRLVPLDDKATASLGAANVRDLSGQGALAVIGLISSDVQAAIQPDMAKNDLSGIGLTLNTPDVLTRNPTPNLFTPFLPAWANAGVEMTFAQGLLKSSPKLKVGLLAVSTTSGQDLMDRFTAAVQAGGNTIGDKELVANDATDLSAAAAKLAAAGVDVILTGVPDNKLVLLMRPLRGRNASVPVVNYNSGSGFSTLMNLADPNLYVVRDIGYSTDTTAGMKKFVAAATASGFDPNSAFLDRGYLEAMIAAAGLRRCGDGCTAKKMTEALTNVGTVDTQGFTAANLAFTPRLHVGTQQVKIYHFQGGSVQAASGDITVTYDVPK